MYWSVGFLVSVVLAAWAFFHIWQSPTETVTRVLWSLFVVVFPFFGTLIWFIAGPKAERSSE